MIDFEVIVSRIQSRTECDRDEAWTAISTAWLKIDRNRSEPEQAEYLFIAGSMRVLDGRTSDSKVVPVSWLHCQDEDEDSDWRDNLFVSREQNDDNQYIIQLVREVPEMYRLALAYVVHSLLSSPVRNRRKELTLETTRQYLKKAGIPKATEMARQVHTFLTTMEEGRCTRTIR